MERRIVRLRELLQDMKLDSALIYKPENRRYMSGFTGSSGYVFITMDKAYFITDFRYAEQAAAQCEGYEILQHSNEKTLYQILENIPVHCMGFEGDFVTYQEHKELTEKLPEVHLESLEDALSKLRIIKDDQEIACIEKAAEIADKAFTHICRYIKPGVSEWEIALELESFMKKQGASATSFDSIVASGKRSSLPHGVASDKLIEAGDFVTLDFGCIYQGYCSDMTRTVVVGKATEKQREIYEIVLDAQIRALESIRPGVTGIEVDKVARDIISSKGYGAYFGHGLGHGVGLEIHESPRLSPLGKDVLQPGMIVTDEPGIYLPDFGGVRIEDLVLVTETGHRRLSKSTKELIEL
ncbi:Xaa-Pro aminopeptidase [Geosporobacter subterraneus DSM 17957]|uniref:Xaa-Pro aminopeptidase n=1 Tax=Geosporobacter subterraneus DSM 17957 TaxID=1121919 RepID=A0A1M6C2T9_9FIRM|nr:Xaa-Pro peptidase family protein [Geosporobacter subterraneus]SHI55028.1 Xaa-Pro aminopeptidase [Geosporobacter subterraneus DSM 17957]